MRQSCQLKLKTLFANCFAMWNRGLEQKEPMKLRLTYGLEVFSGTNCIRWKLLLYQRSMTSWIFKILRSLKRYYIVTTCLQQIIKPSTIAIVNKGVVQKYAFVKVVNNHQMPSQCHLFSKRKGMTTTLASFMSFTETPRHFFSISCLLVPFNPPYNQI